MPNPAQGTMRKHVAMALVAVYPHVKQAVYFGNVPDETPFLIQNSVRTVFFAFLNVSSCTWKTMADQPTALSSAAIRWSPERTHAKLRSRRGDCPGMLGHQSPARGKILPRPGQCDLAKGWSVVGSPCVYPSAHIHSTSNSTTPTPGLRGVGAPKT